MGSAAIDGSAQGDVDVRTPEFGDRIRSSNLEQTLFDLETYMSH